MEKSHPFPTSVKLFTTYSPEDIAKMKADIAVLQKAYDGLADAGLRKVLSVWIEDAKKTLAIAEATKKSWYQELLAKHGNH